MQFPNHLHTLISFHPSSPDGDPAPVSGAACAITAGADLFSLAFDGAALTARIIPNTDATGSCQITFTASPVAEGVPGLTEVVNFVLVEAATSVPFTVSFGA